MLLLGSFFVYLSALFAALSKSLYDDFNESLFSGLNEDFWNPIWSWRNRIDGVTILSMISSLLLTTGMAFVIMGALNIFSHVILWNSLLTFITYQVTKYVIYRILTK